MITRARCVPTSRRLPLVLGVALVGAAGCGGRTAPARPADLEVGTLTAREIVLVDAQGNRRGLLATSDDGAVRFHLWSDDGTERAVVGVERDMSLVVLFDPSGRQGVGLAALDGMSRVDVNGPGPAYAHLQSNRVGSAGKTESWVMLSDELGERSLRTTGDREFPPSPAAAPIGAE